jgi:hypothetical protein
MGKQKNALTLPPTSHQDTAAMQNDPTKREGGGHGSASANKKTRKEATIPISDNLRIDNQSIAKADGSRDIHTPITFFFSFCFEFRAYAPFCQSFFFFAFVCAHVVHLQAKVVPRFFLCRHRDFSFHSVFFRLSSLLLVFFSSFWLSLLSSPPSRHSFVNG